MDNLLKALDPDGTDLSVCEGTGGRCMDKGAIFDNGLGEYGQHILSSDQVQALLALVEQERQAAREELGKKLKVSRTYTFQPVGGISNIEYIRKSVIDDLLTQKEADK